LWDILGLLGLGYISHPFLIPSWDENRPNHPIPNYPKPNIYSNISSYYFEKNGLEKNEFKIRKCEDFKFKILILKLKRKNYLLS